MAEANIRLHDVVLKQEQQESSYLTPGIIKDDNGNVFSSRSHEYIDFYQLLNSFINELREKVSCASIEYENKDAKNSLVNGSTGKHHCEYTLNHEKLSLGVIRITRDSEFLNNELNIIEDMLAGLTMPLHNTLQHQQAIWFAQRDELTGLRNGSYYHDVVDLEIKRFSRYKTPFSLLVLGLDDFNAINTRYGRQAGDTVLYEVADRISEKARNSDIVYRIGGDKFLVFLPNTDKAGTIITATRIKDFVLSKTCEYKNILISFTLSVGVVTVADGDSVDKLIGRVDKALFHAKNLGKNCIYADSFASKVGAELL